MDSREENSQIRHRRDQLLEATARAANVLLTLANLSEAINIALNIIGEGAGCDLIAVIENNFESASPLPTHCEFIYEWALPGLPLLTANLSSKSFPSEFFGLEFLEKYFLEGSGFGGCLEDWHEPLRSWLASVQIQSAHTVPIRVNGQWWGILCFDYCRAPIQIDPAEVAVLRTIADCIGSAIQRERLRHAELRLQQERQQFAQQRTADLEEYNQRLLRRDRLLEVTARATNVLVTQDSIDIAMNRALTILIEGTGCDRIEILENVYESSSPMPIRYLHTIQKCLDPKFENPTDIEPDAAAELRDTFQKYFLEMDGFGGLLEEWDEPLRSWLANLQIQSTYAVPIRLKGQWWGILCFDYCRAPIQFSPAEVAVLRTTADCIGSVIERERLRQAELRLQQERQQVSQKRTADLEAYNQVLQGRDRLFEATAKATNVLLNQENFDEAINTALQIILESAGCDRIEVLENDFDSISPMPQSSSVIYEWASPGITRQMSAGIASKRTNHEGMKAFLEQHFLHGDGFAGLLKEWAEPLRSTMLALQVKSSCSVPIRVNGYWWGCLSLNYCREATWISPAEGAVLRTIADCIGSAIQRERLHHAALRTQQEREHIAQQRTADLEEYNHRLIQRDRLFAATAKAANVLLTLENLDTAVNTALQCIGEGIGCDYVEVLENMFQPPSSLPRSCDFLYEWAAPGLLPLSVSFGSKSLPAELLGLDFMKQYFLEGDGFGGLTEVWNEPLRSVLVSVQVQSTYVVPIRVDGQWWGVLGLDYCQAPIQISAAAISVLMAIADCIGSAIQRDRTRKAILQTEQNRVLELAKANDAMRRSIDWLAHDPDMNAFLGHVLQELAAQFDAQDAQIFLYNSHDRTLQTLVALVGDEITFLPPYTLSENVDGWSGWEVLLQSPKPRSFSLDTESHLFLPDYLEFHHRRNNRGIVCTLLRQDEQPIGMIGFACRNRETFSESELELVQSLAQQATLAIELTRLAQEAQQAALLQERTRMAREIHDTLAQAFGGILMQLQAFSYFAQTEPDQAEPHLLTAQALAQEGLAEARRSVWTLYLETTEYENLDQALAKFIQQTQAGQATPIHLMIEGTPYSLHPDSGLNLLRIAQEAITNALRHAHAATIQVHLSYSAHMLQLTIGDDGCGFEPQSAADGFGLLGMQQRASRIGATWNLMSRPGQGTTLMVTLTNSQNTSVSKV